LISGVIGGRLRESMNRIFETWNAPLVNIAGTVISSGRLVSSVLILIIGFWLSGRVRYLLLHRITPHFKIHQNTGYALAAVAYHGPGLPGI